MQKKIAIIGGGISGLGAAYYLLKNLTTTIDIHLFEAGELHGGNADTVFVNLGQLNGTDFIRWADLGVNDVNLDQYQHLRSIMQDIGFDIEANLLKLEDSECYFEQATNTVYTTDNNATDYVIDKRYSFVNMDNGSLHKLQYLFHENAKYIVKENKQGSDKTVDAFFQQVQQSSQQQLTQYIDQLPDQARVYAAEIDWNNSALIESQLNWLRTYYYYPRISAMYFADPQGPGQMPLRSPFAYYQLQEGGNADRRYFRHGSSQWIESLANYLKQNFSNVHIHTQTPARVQVHDEEAKVFVGGSTAGEKFDAVVFACHANQAKQAIRSDSNYTDREQVERWLNSITYTTSYACCHTDSSVLPRNRNTWRTYNVEIRSPENSSFPYEIHYVCNRHQNDKNNPIYQNPEFPIYFVSLTHNPNRIAKSAILNRVEAPKGEPTLCQINLETPSGYGGEHDSLYETTPIGDALLARTVLYHNVLDQSCLTTQNEINEWQFNAKNRTSASLYFCAGWTNGAGLQEQCLEQAETLAKQFNAA